MRIILPLFIFISTLFASNLSKEHILNSIKSLIQKEEILALAINRYILEKAKLPKKDGKFDWNELENGYLVNFDKKSPFLNKDLEVTFDVNNNIFIKGIILTDTDFNTELKYAYNIYTDTIFRVNTIPPSNSSTVDTLKTNLKYGTQVAYSNIQKDIIEKLNNSKLILFPNQKCTSTGYFYELRGKELIYKFCKVNTNSTETTHIDVYQKSPLYLEDKNDLSIIKGNIGDRAYIKTETGIWEEYYFDNESGSGWVNIFTGKSISNNTNNDTNFENQIINYIPKAMDLFIRPFGGCYLAYGDIFCWGDNKYKKSGIENYGQLDTTLTPDYINTPVMLKVAIEDVLTSNGTKLEIKNLAWYNSIYRVKFEKMGINSKNVCGISPIFTEVREGNTIKIGGDLYCNGLLDWNNFEKPYNTISSNETSILSKYKFFAKDKGEITNNKNPIFLTDIAMNEDTTLVLGHYIDIDKKDLYVFGKNTKGALGLNSNDESKEENIPKKINIALNGLEDINFKQIVATRDAKMFGALSNDNYFYIWGETPKGVINKPTQINNTKYQEDIQPQSRTFILKEANINGKFVYINSDNNISDFTKDIQTDNIEIAAYYNYNGSIQTPYINQNKEIKEINGQNNYLKCKTANGDNCSSEEDKLFEDSFNYLNRLEDGINQNGENVTSASFTNLGLFRSPLNETILNFENFEDGLASGWNKYKVYNKAESSTSNFLGVYGNNSLYPESGTYKYSGDGIVITTDGTQQIYKTYTFSHLKNKTVKLSFDMYEIGSWDADTPNWVPTNTNKEQFSVYINDNLVARDMYGINDITKERKEDRIGVQLNSIQFISAATGSSVNRHVRKHYYEFDVTLNANGSVKVGFGANLKEGYSDEAFGIDNILINNNSSIESSSSNENIKPFLCAKIGIGVKSQLYCWGNVGRSLPILNTSLYDISKIPSVNKLFITQNSEKTNQMAYDNYNNEGSLFLKYPTYISGFDYNFKFK